MAERAKPTFKVADLRRAIKVFKDEGLPIGGAKIATDGSIEIFTENRSEREDALAAWERKHGHL